MRRRDRDNDVGRAIAGLRGPRTQAKLAEAINMDPGPWSLWETGARRPTERSLVRILTALGCSRLEFEETVWTLRRERLAEEEGPPSSPPPPPAPVTARGTQAGDELRAALHAHLSTLLTPVVDMLLFLVNSRSAGPASALEARNDG